MNYQTRVKTREWFRDNALACIADAESGKIKLASHYSLEQYRADMQARAAAAVAGEYDNSFTFRQRAEWIEGKPARALLPNY